MADRTSDPTRLLIVYYSRSGAVEALAAAAAEAARGAGAEVRVRRPREVADAAAMAKVEGWTESAARQNDLYQAPTHEDAEWADAILFGTPSYFGAMATELKNFLDLLGPQWKRGALAGKVGGAFATASWPHGGSEVVTLSLYAPMAHLGMVATPTRRCWKRAHPMARPRSSAKRTSHHGARIWTPRVIKGGGWWQLQVR